MNQPKLYPDGVLAIPIDKEKDGPKLATDEFLSCLTGKWEVVRAVIGYPEFVHDYEYRRPVTKDEALVAYLHGNTTVRDPDEALGLDSLGLIRLVAFVENTLGINISDTDLEDGDMVERCYSLNSLRKYLFPQPKGEAQLWRDLGPDEVPKAGDRFRHAACPERFTILSLDLENPVSHHVSVGDTCWQRPVSVPQPETPSASGKPETSAAGEWDGPCPACGGTGGHWEGCRGWTALNEAEASLAALREQLATAQQETARAQAALKLKDEALKESRRFLASLQSETAEWEQLVKDIRLAIATVAPANENIEERTTLDALNVLFRRIAHGHWPSETPIASKPETPSCCVACEKIREALVPLKQIVNANRYRGGEDGHRPISHKYRWPMPVSTWEKIGEIAREAIVELEALALPLHPDAEREPPPVKDKDEEALETWLVEREGISWPADSFEKVKLSFKAGYSAALAHARSQEGK